MPKSKIKMTFCTLALYGYLFMPKSKIKVTVGTLVLQGYLFMPKSKIKVTIDFLYCMVTFYAKIQNKEDIL
jgi:hypothetical protein